MTNERTFIIADNRDITSDALELYITRLGDYRIVRSDSVKSLAAFLNVYRDAVLLLDPQLLDFGNITALKDFLNLHTGNPTVLIPSEVSSSIADDFRALRNVSLVLKRNSREEIISAIKSALRGDRYFSYEITSLLLSASQKPQVSTKLTYTETEILKLIADGLSVKEIAASRNCSIHTVNSHKKNIFHKLHINSVYEATKYALRAGLKELVEYYI